MIEKAVQNIFDRYFQVQQFEDFLARFKTGFSIEVSEGMRSSVYVDRTKEGMPQFGMRGLMDGLKKLECDRNSAALASGLEFILEGLHLHRRLNKEKVSGKTAYRA